jgi:hypothetical protein
MQSLIQRHLIIESKKHQQLIPSTSKTPENAAKFAAAAISLVAI